MNAIDPAPPDWLDGERVYPKDAIGWLRELERIAALLWPGLAQWRDEWRHVIGPDIDEAYPAYIGPPPIEVIERDEALASFLP